MCPWANKLAITFIEGKSGGAGMNAKPVGTLRSVEKKKGSRRLPPEMERRIAAIVEDEIRAKYRGKSERHIAEAMGLSQPVLNQIRNGEGGIGVHALLALRAYTKRSIDDLLGLDEAPAPVLDRNHKAMEEALLGALQKFHGGGVDSSDGGVPSGEPKRRSRPPTRRRP
jgi:transcriptional regulator with XRE-family HTH domain